MESGYIIFIFFLILLITFLYLSSKQTYELLTADQLTKEPFVSYTTAAASCAPKKLVRDPVKPEVAQLGVGTIEPSTIVNDLPSTSYVPSRAASMPYRNPGTEPARYIQILSVLQQLQAFFGFEAPAIEDDCDPTVVLPLQQARADMAQLLMQVDVLEHNPGVPSTITMKELVHITSNLRYLQKIARKYKANTGTELLGSNVSTIEKFVDAGSQSDDEADDPEMTPASLDELKGLKAAVESAMDQLKATTAGTTDAVTVQRIATLDRLRADIDEIIKSVESGAINADQIPIYSDDIRAISKNLGDTNKAIGTIIRNVALPPELAKIFPSDMSWKDKITLQDINKDIKQYMSKLADGMSWTAKGDIGIELKYDSPRAVTIASQKSASTTQAEEFSTVGTTEDIRYQMTGLNPDGTRKIFSDPPAGDFDWKKRAAHICAQIRKRGMKSADFGCVDPDVVSSDYSWRGNVKLVCSRLEHTADPGLPVACGCPPKKWLDEKTN